MNLRPLTPEQLRGVFAVPPLSRQSDAHRSLDFDQSQLIVKHVAAGGITRLIYGGNAFLYHITLTEFGELIEWLSDLPGDLWLIPSIGPSFGRALEQAALVRKYAFPAIMMLPCGDPRDASGLERGYREIADVAGCPLIIYLKDENNFGFDKNAGLDAVARLVDDGICAGIKYALVLDDPTHDPYLEALLARIDRKFVISGIGERPAVVHLRDWQLAGFTTGSGCIAPKLSQQLFEALAREDFDTALTLREKFLPLEDLRDEWGPARVLHHATELAGISHTGPIAPYVSELTHEQVNALVSVVRSLQDGK